MLLFLSVSEWDDMSNTRTGWWGRGREAGKEAINCCAVTTRHPCFLIESNSQRWMQFLRRQDVSEFVITRTLLSLLLSLLFANRYSLFHFQHKLLENRRSFLEYYIILFLWQTRHTCNSRHETQVEDAVNLKPCWRRQTHTFTDQVEKTVMSLHLLLMMVQLTCLPTLEMLFFLMKPESDYSLYFSLHFSGENFFPTSRASFSLWMKADDRVHENLVFSWEKESKRTLYRIVLH